MLCGSPHVTGGPRRDYTLHGRSHCQPPPHHCTGCVHTRQRTLQARVTPGARKAWGTCLDHDLQTQATYLSLSYSIQIQLTSAAGGQSAFPPRALQRQYVDSRPELVQQWHPSRNGCQRPGKLTLGSQKKIWWLCTACPCGQAHVWQTTVNHRDLNSRGYPVCAGKRPCACSSLAALRSDIARQWDPAGNDGLRPEDVTVASRVRARWVCTKHEQPSPGELQSVIVPGETDLQAAQSAPARRKSQSSVSPWSKDR